jgi:peroxiredoxin
MSEHKKTNKLIWILIPVIGVVIIAGAIFAVINKQAPQKEYVETTEAAADSTVAVTAAKSKNTLDDIVKSAQSWGVVFKPWFGKTVPELTVTDIKGRQHSLSSYRGKDVMVVFWATWCPACNLEIPHLIELRKQIGEDELVIIAISNEDPETLKAFVNNKGINYSVVSSAGTMLPSPFADVTSIPTTFYIDRNGRIKLVAVGLVELDDTKAILKAEG